MHQFFLTYILSGFYKNLTPLSGLSEQLFICSTHNLPYPILCRNLRELNEGTLRGRAKITCFI